MISIVLVTISLLVATSNADGESCQNWNLVCNQQQPSSQYEPVLPVIRGKMGPRGSKGEKGDDGVSADLYTTIESLKHKTVNLEKENLALKETIEKINETVSAHSAKIDLLKQEKRDFNETLAIQGKEVENLKELSKKQAETLETLTNITSAFLKSEANKTIQLEDGNSNQTKKNDLNTACHLPHIKHLSNNVPKRALNNQTIELSCSKLVPFGVTKRTCNYGNWAPDFESHAFDCKELFRANWESAKKFCLDRGTIMLSYGLETYEKRNAVCIKYEGVSTWLWTGIRRTNGSWKHSNGSSLVGFDFDWSQRAPQNNEGFDYVVILCDKDNNPGSFLLNYPNYVSLTFFCQN